MANGIAGSETPDGSAGMHGRIRQLDGVRALAFLAVFVHHAFGVPMLWWGVDVFFAMSGFLITGILLRQARGWGFFSRFYLRRAFRIVPPYLLVLAAAVLFSRGTDRRSRGIWRLYRTSFSWLSRVAATSRC
jgi:peptidoglycan/LPS O-acetylase OafA/YrhL